MPCTEVFDAQDEAYRESVLPEGRCKARVAVEAGATLGWWKYVGLEGRVLGIDRFGASGKVQDLFPHFGFTADNVGPADTRSCSSRKTDHSRQLFSERMRGMAIKVGINGYGRIGRNILRALYEAKRTSEVQIVALNDLGDAKTNAHLTRYDTAHGKFPGEVAVDGDSMVVNGDRIRVLAERDPAKLPWGELGVEYRARVHGLVHSKAKAGAHLKGGAKKVVISAPGGEDVDATIVYGVNHNVLKKDFTVISNASCTTNCLAPVAKVLHDKVGIVAGIMTTIHSYTNDQVLTDVYHSDLRRARSATMSQIPDQDRRRRRGGSRDCRSSRASSMALPCACRRSTSRSST